jgi:NAD(P)H dehydrogenase (quinone)
LAGQAARNVDQEPALATKVLIAFYSRNGATEALANAIAEGVTAQGGEVRLRRAREVVSAEVMAHVAGWAENAARMNAKYEAPSDSDSEWADAIVFGSPTRFGAVGAELKNFIDGLGALWFQGKLAGKAGAAFCATSSMHGGNEATIISLYGPMAHLGLIIVPLGYADPVMFRAGTPYGASAVSFGVKLAPPSDDDLEVARYQGRRVTQVATALRNARPTAA